MCGEKSSRLPRRLKNAGSPPRVRGKVRPGVVRGHEGGITPAYAGKRVHSELEGPRSEDHPRVCGEKHTHLNGTFLNLGSPPRMRGKAPLLSKAPSECGITPACAGKSGPCPDRGPPAEDHPRVCGEKHLYGAKFETKGTSPPRVRGKGRPGRLRVWLARITPAYAGKSSLACCPWRLHRDHPRVCGEKHRPSKTQSRPAGSPPRMRGKVVRLCMATGLRRITPAYAGKSVATPL